LGKKLTKDTPDNLIADCAEQFRKVYPELFENYVKDYPRHTAISARATSSENPDTTATWAGNSAKEVKESYWGRMAVEETIQHYRRIPTQLRGKLDPTTVALPSWFNRQTLEQAAKEQAHVNEKVTEVTSVTNGAPTRRPHLAPASREDRLAAARRALKAKRDAAKGAVQNLSGVAIPSEAVTQVQAPTKTVETEVGGVSAHGG
jgi:hypothetical protein